MKRCGKCKVEKPTESFCKRRSEPDGLNGTCRECCRLQGEAWRSRPEYKAEHREAQRAYRKSEKHKQHYREYCARSAVIEARRVDSLRKYYKNPDHTKARVEVRRAIKRGKLADPHTMACRCGAPATEYHHESYAREDWLKVVPLCAPCHDILHRVEAA